MSSESAKRFESLHREFNAYVDHITQEAKATENRKQQQVVEPVVATESAPPAVVAEPVAKNRGRKPKEAVAAAAAC